MTLTKDQAHRIELALIIIGSLLILCAIGLFVWLTYLEASKVITDCTNQKNTIKVGSYTFSFPMIVLGIGAFCVIGQYLPGIKKLMKG
jgi:hypothetical protein